MISKGDMPEKQTARKWLTDFGWSLADPREISEEELNMEMGHDEFWEWSSGKVDFVAGCRGNTSWSTAIGIWVVISVSVLLLLLLTYLSH